MGRQRAARQCKRCGCSLCTKERGTPETQTYKSNADIPVRKLIYQHPRTEGPLLIILFRSRARRYEGRIEDPCCTCEPHHPRTQDPLALIFLVTGHQSVRNIPQLDTLYVIPGVSQPGRWPHWLNCLSACPVSSEKVYIRAVLQISRIECHSELPPRLSRR